ncbi:hypothetical protein TNCV_4664211 [Trichonephila clavipes]|nr:hypothetical protein TNCV_4664211 [Trichonephila clavipes]
MPLIFQGQLSATTEEYEENCMLGTSFNSWEVLRAGFKEKWLFLDQRYSICASRAVCGPLDLSEWLDHRSLH